MTQTIAKPTTKGIEPILDAFDHFLRDDAAKNPPWLRATRESGIAHFAELGFPTTRHEEWKYTSVSPIAKLPFKLAKTNPISSRDASHFTFHGLKSSVLVFVNGHFVPEISKFQSPISSLLPALASEAAPVKQHLARYARLDANPFVALNTAFFSDGAFIVIPKGKVIAEPIHLLFLSATGNEGATTNVRNLIVAEENSQAHIIEHYASLGDTLHFTNAVTEIVVGDGAMIEHCKIQDENLTAFHIATIQAKLGRSAKFLSHSISLGARLARNNINLVLAGEGGDAILNGLYVASGDQLVDHHTIADHTVAHCNSHEFYHGVLDGHARGVFNGKIFVRPDAQKTDAKQTNRNLLLSDTATVDTKPQLEIFADDVKCTHGATVGQLNDEEIFYLRTRGIGLAEARRILTLAFASDIIHRIQIPAVRDHLHFELTRRLTQPVAAFADRGAKGDAR